MDGRPLEIGVRSLVPHDPTLDKWLKMEGCIQYEGNCTSKKVHVDMIFSYLGKKYIINARLL